MALNTPKSVRLEGDIEKADPAPINKLNFSKFTKAITLKLLHNTIIRKEKQLSRVFSEDYDGEKRMILDPRGDLISKWNKCLIFACLVSLFVDPLFFYLPVVGDEACMDISIRLHVVLTIVRSIVDAFYILQIYVRFRTAYVAPSSRVIGRGELVIDPSKIASRYLKKDFWLDILAALPLPQVAAWVAISSFRIQDMLYLKYSLRLGIILQSLLRLYLFVPLSSQISKANGIITETAWAGAAYNLLLYMLASHVIGSCWYLHAIDKQEECWKIACGLNKQKCPTSFFNCKRVLEPGTASWFKSMNITSICAPTVGIYQYGIYNDAVLLGIAKTKFINKYLYCLWWGIRNISSGGQTLLTSTSAWENIFVIIIAILGLLLFALLIGNMQTYLQSMGMRLEEWRIRRTDTEQWMHHRQLPHKLKERVRKHDRYRWVTTHGVDEEAILQGLPLDLRRDIKRHLCLDLVRKVSLFDQLDEHVLDAICVRLKPVLCPPGTCLVSEGDTVCEILFIIRGHLDSYTTNGGQTGFFNSGHLGPGDFCGEELLMWTKGPHQGSNLPSSTRTVKALSEVEAFSLGSEDVKYVTSKFRKLHSKKLKHNVRCLSHQWRTWAACFIQAAWFRYRRRKQASALTAREKSKLESALGLTMPISEFTCVWGGSLRGLEFDLKCLRKKPVDPDFTLIGKDM